MIVLAEYTSIFSVLQAAAMRVGTLKNKIAITIKLPCSALIFKELFTRHIIIYKH